MARIIRKRALPTVGLPPGSDLQAHDLFRLLGGEAIGEEGQIGVEGDHPAYPAGQARAVLFEELLRAFLRYEYRGGGGENKVSEAEYPAERAARERKDRHDDDAQEHVRTFELLRPGDSEGYGVVGCHGPPPFGTA